MKSRKFSIDWMLFASAGIFLMVGKLIARRYEVMLLESGLVEEVVPISRYCLIVSYFLIACLIGRWIYRIANRWK